MDIRTALTVALTILTTFAKYTATTIDDTVVAGLQALLANEALLLFFERLISDPNVLNTKDESRTVNIQTAAQGLFQQHKEENPTDATLGQELAKVGIPMPTFLSMLPLLIRLLLTLMGKRR